MSSLSNGPSRYAANFHPLGSKRFVITSALGGSWMRRYRRARTIRQITRRFLDDGGRSISIEWLDSDDPVHWFDIAIRHDIGRYIEGSVRVESITVLAWLIGLSFISGSLIEREKARVSATGLRIIYYSLIFLFFPSSFFTRIQNTQIPCCSNKLIRRIPVFFPLTERWTGEEGRIISASFECRVIKNNWHGKCNDIASGSRIY